jgi:hypothetical protein
MDDSFEPRIISHFTVCHQDSEAHANSNLSFDITNNIKRFEFITRHCSEPSSLETSQTKAPCHYFCSTGVNHVVGKAPLLSHVADDANKLPSITAPFLLRLSIDELVGLYKSLETSGFVFQTPPS